MIMGYFFLSEIVSGEVQDVDGFFFQLIAMMIKILLVCA
jgi:hypothetical protein